MNYGELLTNIRDLAFEEDEQMEEYESIVVNAINRALSTIEQEVAPIRKYIEIEQDGTDEEYQFYVMPSLTGGKFLDFDANPVRIDDGDEYVPFGDFDIETGDTIVMDGAEEGTFRIFYKSAHTPYTTSTDDSTELPIPLRAHHLVPLLCAYYVWLDDDQQKAIMYYNQYETLANVLLANAQRPRMRVRTDWYSNTNSSNLNVSVSEWRNLY